jgi:hypothetical protein
MTVLLTVLFQIEIMKPIIHAGFKALYELLRGRAAVSFQLSFSPFIQTILMRMGQPYHARGLVGGWNMHTAPTDWAAAQRVHS